jgi:hypothetical protein
VALTDLLQGKTSPEEIGLKRLPKQVHLTQIRITSSRITFAKHVGDSPITSAIRRGDGQASRSCSARNIRAAQTALIE